MDAFGSVTAPMRTSPATICERTAASTTRGQASVSGSIVVITQRSHTIVVGNLRFPRKTWFGTRLVPLGTGTIAVGDAVEPGNAHD